MNLASVPVHPRRIQANHAAEIERLLFFWDWQG